jgi:multiple antibiotic resistance protein
LETGWTEYTRFVIALSTIINPVGAVPVFLAATREFSAQEKCMTARVTAIAVGGVLVAAALSGEVLLGVMGTSLSAFRVGGGIVILLMAIAMLSARGGDPLPRQGPDSGDAESVASIAVVPLGIPLLAGPGAISTSIIQMHRGAGLVHAALVAASILLVALVCWIVLRNAERVGAFIGPVGLNVISRLFGLLLSAIAMETIANGLKGLFPILAG